MMQLQRRMWGGTLVMLALSAATAGAEPLGAEFPPDRYVQEIRLTFPTSEAAQAATFQLAPLFDGYRHALGSRWDDNCDNNSEMKKRLDDRGVKATWYLNVAPFERNPGADDFREVARRLLENGHSIGGHSYSHPYITYTHRNRMFYEMAATRIAWEAMLDTPVLSYTFSYVDFTNEVEGVGVQADLIRLLERAGFYHVAEFKTFSDLTASSLIHSLILPPENNDLETFRRAVDWAFDTPEIAAQYPGVSHSMHAWYGTERSAFGWDELERRLDYANAKPDIWHCNHNQYAAYRYQYLHSSLEAVDRSGPDVVLRLTRPVVRFLNDTIPLTLVVESPAKVAAVRCETADVVASNRSAEGRTLFNVSHNYDQRLPTRIGRVENDANRGALSQADEDADFPGLRLLLSASMAGLHLRVENHAGDALTDLHVTYRLPLMWKEGIRHVRVDDLAPGAGWEERWSPQPGAVDPKLLYGPAYAVAQLDFVQGGEAGRLYATCLVPTSEDASFPKNRFAVMGPISPNVFSVEALESAVAAKAFDNGWTLPDGTALTWRDNAQDGPVDQAILDPEVVRTLGSWYQLESPVYVLRSYVHADRARPVSWVSSPGDIRRVFLNGVVAEEGRGELQAGRNDLLVVYHCGTVGGTPRHAGCLLRLVDPQTGERLTDIRYERPPVTQLKVALLQMLPKGANQAANLEKADQFCREAARLGADIALFPEMFNIGYTPFQGVDRAAIEAWQAQAVGLDSPYVAHFRALAKELDMAIGVTYLQTWEGAPRNALTLVDRHGNTVLTYAKVHTCDFSNFEAATTPGDAFHVAPLDTRHGMVQVGAMICFDREFPESARILMLEGAEVILTPNACLLDDTRLHQFQSRALENSLAVFMTNYPAPLHGGRSVAYGPGGECLVEANGDEGVFIGAIDLTALRDYRRRTIWGNAFRRPHRYGRLTDMAVDPLWQRSTGLGEVFRRETR